MSDPMILWWFLAVPLGAVCVAAALYEGGRIALERRRIRAARNRATDLWLGIQEQRR